MGDDLMVFSWNLEKKSHQGLTSNSDNVSRVVDNIADVVRTGEQGADTPFVGFLLEITGSRENVAKLCHAIREEYLKKTKQEISVTSRSTKGGVHTRESIILMSRGVDVAASKFDVQKGLTAFIEEDKAGARRAHEDRLLNNRRFRDRSSHPYARPKEWHNRKVNREPKWFRNGTIAEVKQGERKLRIAAVHAPGPDLSNKVDEVVDSIVNSAQGNNVDILIGDLNRRGALPSTHFDDISKSWTSGTTFGKKEPEKLGTSRWDRVLASRGREFAIESPQPVAVTRPVDLGKRLTDHALVYARISDKVVSGSTFNLTSATGSGGADLRSLESSQALIQPADPTLLYGAASDRKNPSDEQLQKQLKQQLDENPLTSNSSEPASDPLSPPSASSPLTEPPASSAMDEGIEAESAEAMDAMAAEGEEVADMVVALL